MKKARVLIVDDDRALSRAFKQSIEGAGPYDVRVENDPQQAARVAAEFEPDVVVLDVIMPKMDGGSVAAEIRANEKTKDIPIIFVTSIVGKQEAADKGGRIGGETVLAKPVSASDLMRAIEACLRKSKRGDQ